MSEHEIRLGDRIKDKISGLTGIASGMTEYINGCRQWLIEPERVGKDGEPLKGVWIDEAKIELVKVQIFNEPAVFSNERLAASKEGRPMYAGGPQDSPKPMERE